MLFGVLVASFGSLALLQHPPTPNLKSIERNAGGRLGVFVLDTGSGRSIGFRADQRFLMCSTYKILVVAHTLARVDAGKDKLDQPVAYGKADILEYAPVTGAHLDEGKLSVQALCEAAITESDNTAANLLLARLGGPAALTRYARSIGDRSFRNDRNEPEVNVPKGILDTTTPRSMAESVRRILFGRVLSTRSRGLLEGWMRECKTGVGRLRAGFPTGWLVADKTGSGHWEANDVAVVYPPNHPALIVAAFYQADRANADERDRVLAQVSKYIGDWVETEAGASQRIGGYPSIAAPNSLRQRGNLFQRS